MDRPALILQSRNLIGALTSRWSGPRARRENQMVALGGAAQLEAVNCTERITE